MNKIIITAVITILFVLSNIEFVVSENNEQGPRIINDEKHFEEMVVAGIVATEDPFNADNTGEKDATGAIQQALFASAQQGTGSVWLPRGEYKIEGSLNIPEGVTLKGSWQPPQKQNSIRNNTLLKIYKGRGEKNGDSAIKLNSGSGIKGLSVYYPEQDINDVKEYPPTFEQIGKQNVTVENTTLFNSYQGFDFADQNDELHFLNNIYMTVLNLGVEMEFIYDVGRITELYISPSYWAESGLKNAPEDKKIASYTKDNTVGIKTGFNDWHYMYNISITDCKSGIEFVESEDASGGNGSIYGLNVENSRYGLHFKGINPYGWSITNANFKSEFPDDIAVKIENNAGDSSIQLNRIKFSGKGQAVQVEEGYKGGLSLQNIIFENTRDLLVEVLGGSVSLQYFEFADFAGVDLDKLKQNEKKPIKLGPQIDSAVIRGSGHKSLFDVQYEEKEKILDTIREVLYSFFDTSTVNTEKMVIEFDEKKGPESIPGQYQLTEKITPFPAKKDPDSLYVVTEEPFNAEASSWKDNTQAIQKALKTAGENGGGTVFIPAGRFIISSPLNVPPGVELRGAHDVQFHTTSARTVLMARDEVKENNGEKKPLISLESDSEKGSGVTGLVIYYIGQKYTNDDFPVKFPWTIQALGPNCWVTNTVLPNSYKGVDFASYNTEGHVIDFLSGAVLKKGLKIGNSQQGLVQNVHYNPHYWIRTDLPGNISDDDFSDFWSWQMKTGTAFELLDTGTTLKGNFVYGAQNGLVLTSGETSNSGPSSTIIGHGTDGAYIGLKASSTGEKGTTLINFNAVQFEDGHFVYTEENMADTDLLKIINANHWTAPSIAYNIKGGNLSLQQVHFSHGGSTGVLVEGGQLLLENSFFSRPLDYHLRQIRGQVQVTANIFTERMKIKGDYEKESNITR